MLQLTLTALGVGGSTIFGAVLGFIFREKAEKYKLYILAYAAGVMLLAAVNGLILPAVELSECLGSLKATIGIFIGALCILLPEKIFPRLRESDTEKRRAILTVLAIALHNLPEGIAAGVGFGSGDLHAAFFIAAGIALQNIPEGCVVVAPLVAIGAKPSRAFLVAAFTGVIEIVGTLVGYLAVSTSKAILPYALSFAGGAMLYVILCEMMPELSNCEAKVKILVFFLSGIATMLLLA